MENDAQTLLSWAAALRRQPSALGLADLLTDEGTQRICATDLQAIGLKLERWSAADWAAVLDPAWDADGPLPPWPERTTEA